MRKAHKVYEISYRRGCRLVKLNWSNFTYEPKERPDERALAIRLRDLAGLRVCYGYRRLAVLLRREGWAVGVKRVYWTLQGRGPGGTHATA